MIGSAIGLADNGPGPVRSQSLINLAQEGLDLRLINIKCLGCYFSVHGCFLESLPELHLFVRVHDVKYGRLVLVVDFLYSKWLEPHMHQILTRTMRLWQPPIRE